MCKEISTITGPSADRSHSSHNPVHRNAVRPVLTAVAAVVPDPALVAVVVAPGPALAEAAAVAEDPVVVETAAAVVAGAVADVADKLL